MKTNKHLLTEIMSKIPTSNNGQNIDKQLLRIGLLAELDAINLYEQLAELATDETVKNIFLDISKEEKVHVGEFQSKLEEDDSLTKKGLEDGEEEEEQIENEDMNEAKSRLYGTTATQQLAEMQMTLKKLIK
jgi:rubrerythrin